MTLYEKFKKMNISHSAIGLGQSDDNSPYYCTPKDAEIIGWAGVDGIHYCTIPEFGEMIFAVSPMYFGDCVHPIARNFGDLLSLLLSCADMGVLEQCYAWDREQYDAFLLDCPATDEQQSVLEKIRRELAIEPITDAFSYVKELQSEFDLSEIPYTVDYYDPDMNPAAPVNPTEFAEWKVYYDGGFYCADCADGNDDDLCVEIPVEKSFCWDEEKWYVPSVYICGKGLVIDYCVEVDPDRIQAHADKWNLHSEEPVSYTEEQQAELERENPMNIGFRGYVTLNGQKLRNRCGEYIYWQTGGNSVYDRCNPEAEFAVRHYGLDDKRVWVICRCCYEGDVSEGDIRSLSVHIEREREEVAALRFQTPSVGESVAVTNPISGKTFTLTVHSVEQQSLSENAFHDPDMEFPRHFVAMSYSLEPDIPALHFVVQDCTKSDTPVHKNRANNSTAVSFAVIGGADGPVAVGMANSASATTGQNAPEVHTACSSLHFSPVSEVEWKFVFLEKFKGDIDVILI